jgi:predicted aspartyl protease
MEIKEGKLILAARLTGKTISVVEDALIDTGSTFTVLPPEIADRLKLGVYRPFIRETLYVIDFGMR